MARSTAHLLVSCFAFFGTPLLGLITEQAKFAMVSWACATGQQWTLHVIAFLSLFITAVAGLLAFRSWRELGSVRDLSGAATAQWMSSALVLGMMMSVLSVFFIIAMWMPDFLLGVCD